MRIIWAVLMAILLSGGAVAQDVRTTGQSSGGVPSIAGTANQITETGSPGATTLSLPSALQPPGTMALGGCTIGSNELCVTGTINSSGSITTSISLISSSTGSVSFGSRGAISSQAINQINIGPAAVSSSPVQQTLQFQNASGSNTAGSTNVFLCGGLSTGTAADGDCIIQTGVKNGSSGSTAATPTTAITIKGETQNVQLNQITTDATHTDATICEDTTTHGLYFGSGTLGICLGTSSLRFKHGVTDLAPGLNEVLGLSPKSFYLDAAHGNPKKQMYGFIAEDAAKVLPGLVGYDGSGRINTFDYLGLVPVLVRATQQQQTEIKLLWVAVILLGVVLACILISQHHKSRP